MSPQAPAKTGEVWQALFAKAMRMLDDLEQRAGTSVHWTFGGGTVLMLKYHHRLSKDIDIFFPDPQPLAYLNPRSGGLADGMTSEYQESANHLKLIFAEGEIDFVASPSLTNPGFEMQAVEGRVIRRETPGEIIAKKMWHRGDAAKARDLFDLCVVIDHAPDDLRQARKFLIKHREPFLAQLEDRRDILSIQFEQIDALDYCRTFNECVSIASEFLIGLDLTIDRKN